MESTLFTLETNVNTYFVDYDDLLTDLKPYSIFTNEKFRGRFNTYGEALEFIFEDFTNQTAKAQWGAPSSLMKKILNFLLKK